jgi:poly(A) polymerase
LRFRYAVAKNGQLVKKAVIYTSEEHGIKAQDVDPDAAFIISRLEQAGFAAYVVGGAVRDLILGQKPKDFDIATSATPPEIKRLFRNSRLIGKRFKLVHIFFGPKILEVATFRSTESGSVGNVFGTIEDDVLRRDYSINALFYDPQKQLVIDYVGGVKDIWQKKIRPIIPLESIFIEDPVRMIRAVKYACTTGFPLPLKLKWKIKQSAALLAGVSPSRLTEETSKIIHSSCAAQIIDKLEALGLFEYLQPQTSSRFKTDRAYKERYLAGFNTAASGEAHGVVAFATKERPASLLFAAMVRDYLESEIDFAAFQQENYKDAFMLARRFVLPMNPPWVELDGGVKTVFAEHGIVIK